MLERDKQRTDQQKKYAAEKERHAHNKKDDKEQAGKQHAGADTDAETMKDKDYVKRIDEKTEKH